GRGDGDGARGCSAAGRAGLRDILLALNPPRAIFFDLDGTLVDSSVAREALPHACSEIAYFLPGLDPARLLAANQAAWSEYWPQVEDKWTLGGLTGAEISREAWRRALHACCFDSEAAVDIAFRTFSRHAEESTTRFDDARAALDQVHGRLPLVLITNGASDTQRDKLRITGIESLFAHLVISGEAGIAKPDKRVFQMALSSVGAKPADVWHMGDSLASDVGGAKAAGLTAVWLNRH